VSNRFILREREAVHPTIEGVDFGGTCWVIARSPQAVLLWRSAHSWSLNGNSRSAPAEMILLPDRSGRQQVHNQYKRLSSGRRLSRALIKQIWESYPELKRCFGDEAYNWLQAALLKLPRRTLLVEGGGPALMPSRLRAQGEYERWRDLPAEDRGFYVGQS
jgi:hypothetical protein